MSFCTTWCCEATLLSANIRRQQPNPVHILENFVDVVGFETKRCTDFWSEIREPRFGPQMLTKSVDEPRCMEFGERIWRGPPVCPSDEAEQQELKRTTPAGASSSQIESPDSEPRKRRDVRVGRPLLEGAPGLWRVRVARVHVWFRFCPRCVDWRQHLLSAPLVSFVGTLLRSGVHRDARRIRACAR